MDTPHISPRHAAATCNRWSLRPLAPQSLRNRGKGKNHSAFSLRAQGKCQTQLSALAISTPQGQLVSQSQSCGPLGHVFSVHGKPQLLPLEVVLGGLLLCSQKGITTEEHEKCLINTTGNDTKQQQQNLVKEEKAEFPQRAGLRAQQ